MLFHELRLLELCYQLVEYVKAVKGRPTDDLSIKENETKTERIHSYQYRQKNNISECVLKRTRFGLSSDYMLSVVRKSHFIVILWFIWTLSEVKRLTSFLHISNDLSSKHSLIMCFGMYVMFSTKFLYTFIRVLIILTRRILRMYVKIKQLMSVCIFFFNIRICIFCLSFELVYTYLM